MITVTYPDITASDETITVTFTNEASHCITRTFPVPRTDTGHVDETFLQSIIDSTVNKIDIGFVKIPDPDAKATYHIEPQ